MIEIGNLTLPENLNLSLPDDDLIRRGDAVNAIRKACIMGHIPFSTRTPEGRRTLEAMQAVRNVPAANAAPAVHGKWEPSKYMAAIKCGVCGCDIYLDDPEQYFEWNFCPICGAKMDKED